MGSAVGKKLLSQRGVCRGNSAEFLCTPDCLAWSTQSCANISPPEFLLTGNLRFLGPKNRNFFSLVGAFWLGLAVDCEKQNTAASDF